MINIYYILNINYKYKYLKFMIKIKYILYLMFIINTYRHEI